MKFCTNCNSTVTVEVDDAAGNTTCSNCGVVLEENQIVSEVTFSEQANGAAVADGVFLAGDQARAKNRSRFGTVRTNSVESREHTLMNGYRRVEQVGTALQFSERQMDAAKRYFNLAVINNFTKGRKTNNVVAACLYIVSRMEKTSHMLIDFADVLQTNVYILGAAFLRLVQVLRLKLPLIDPALYIARFAGRLDLRDRTQSVVRDALRLVQRMNRDWIQTGRRPAGICAASLFIAARMHGFRRSYREIIRVVKICEATLRKRLDEFKSTPSATLSVSEFQTIWLEEGCDPPSYLKGRGGVGDSSAEQGAQRGAARPRRSASESAPAADAAVKVKAATDESDEADDDAEVFTFDKDLEEEMRQYLQEKDLKKAVQKLAPGLDTAMADEAGRNDDEQDLEALDHDDEVSSVLLDHAEVHVKTQIWMKENQEWLVAQELKARQAAARAERAQQRARAPASRRSRDPTNAYQFSPASTAEEATRTLLDTTAGKRAGLAVSDTTRGTGSSVGSSKIDYSLLKNLFGGDGPPLQTF